jgi:peptide deformylase
MENNIMSIKELVAISDTPSKIEKVEKISSDILIIIRDMIATMEHHNLEYITAPDIGVNQQIIAVDVTAHELGILIAVNPEVVYDEDEVLIVEYVDLSGQVQSSVFHRKLASFIRHALYEIGV